MEEKQIDWLKSNRKGRRDWAKSNKIKMNKGEQDASEATHRQYWVPLTRKSIAGVIYTYYKKVVDLIKK